MKELLSGTPEWKDKPVICLGIDDSYPYRDPELMELIKKKYVTGTLNSIKVKMAEESGDSDGE